MKKIEWINPNKMRIQSGHKTFDQQTNIVSPSAGCTIANTQLSSYIRAFDDLQCNNYTFEPGHLQNVDLNSFKRLPQYVRCAVKRESADRAIKLYRFHHYNGQRRTDHGYVLATTNDILIDVFVTGPSYKSHFVINECLKYIVENAPDNVAV